MILKNSLLDSIMRQMGEESKPKSIFSYSKNRLSYRLSKMDNYKRGRCVEHIVREVLSYHNYDVTYFGGRHPFDMLVNNRIRVEVKSGVATGTIVNGKMQYSYQFHSIKEECFDRLILVFISPEGLDIRQLDKRTVTRYLANSTRYNDGKVLQVSRTSKKKFGERIAA